MGIYTEEDKEYEHPSYGMLRFSRVSGRGFKLFGSDIQHDNIIKMTVSEASMRRHLHQNWYHAEDRLLEVEMSYAQFAEAISAMNTEGVPVTLGFKRTGGGELPEPPPVLDTIDEFQLELEKDILDAGSRLNSLLEVAKALEEKKTASKKDRTALRKGIEGLKRHLTDNMPFLKTQFERAMEKTVSDAKGEIEAYILHKTLGQVQGLVEYTEEAKLIEEV